MGHVESVLSDYGLRLTALEKAVTAVPQLVLETDPSKPTVVVPDYSAQVAPAAGTAAA
jgi:hypothetical protein